MRALLVIALAVLLISPGPADAGPLPGVLAAMGTAFKAAFTAKALLGALLRTALSVGVSLLVQKKQQKQRDPGIQTSYTTTGGTDPQGTVVGWYATAGHLVYRNSHGPNNRYLTHVIEVSDLPGVALDRVIIDGEYSDLGETPHADYGYPILSKQDTGGNDRAWIRFIDGTHAAADAKLVDLYGTDEERPWTTNHILTGIAHAILTFDYHRPVFEGGVPQVRFELTGIPLYDPRADSSVGGSGTQRWADPSTWAATTNPMVIAYNIHRGFALPCGAVWGGGAEAEDLPLDNWTVAMNTCDEPVGTNNRPRYRGGFEIRFTDEPAEVLEELYAAANAQPAELGGRWRVQAGAPAAAVVSVSDDDLLVSEGRQYEPFPGLEETFNAISVTHPSPNALWNAAQPATIENADWEAEDGTQRLYELRLPAAPWAAQARQVAQNMIRDERRFRRHGYSLPPEYFWLEPLDTLAWTSDWNGYASKDFEISEIAYDLRTLVTAVSLRERDPSDFGHVAELELPDPPRVTARVTITDAGVPGFAVTGITLKDGDTTDRRAAILAVWETSLADTARGLDFQVRIAGQTDLSLSASTGDLEAGEAILAPQLPGQGYEVRAKPRARGRKTEWTDWLPVTTPDVRLGESDLDDAIWSRVGSEALSATETLFDNIDRALDFRDGLFGLEVDRLAEFDIAARVSAVLEAARVEGVVDETRTELSAEIDGVSANLATNYVTAATHTSALAGLETTLSAEIDGVSATLSNNYYTIAETDNAVASAETALQSEIDGVSSNLSVNYFTKAQTNSAIAAAETSLQSEIDGVSATLTSGYYTKAQTDSAIAAAELSLQSEIDGVSATLTSGYYTKAQTDSAISAEISAVQTEVDGLSTSVSTVQSSVDGIEGTYGVKVNNNGVISGFGLVSELVDGVPVSSFTINATKFIVTNYDGSVTGIAPFVIDGGIVYISEAVIKTLNASKINIDGVTLTANSNDELVIKSGGVKTDHIGSNQVSQVAANSKGSDEIVPNAAANSWEQVLTTGSKTWLGGKPLLIMATLNVESSYGVAHITYRIKVNGSIVYSDAPTVAISGTLWLPISVAYQATSVAGTYSVTIETYVSNDSGGDTKILKGSTIAAFELKR